MFLFFISSLSCFSADSEKTNNFSSSGYPGTKGFLNEDYSSQDILLEIGGSDAHQAIFIREEEDLLGRIGILKTRLEKEERKNREMDNNQARLVTTIRELQESLKTIENENAEKVRKLLEALKDTEYTQTEEQREYQKILRENERMQNQLSLSLAENEKLSGKLYETEKELKTQKTDAGEKIKELKEKITDYRTLNELQQKNIAVLQKNLDSQKRESEAYKQQASLQIIQLKGEIMALKTPADILFSQQFSEKEVDPKSEVEQIDSGDRKNRNLRVIVASSSSLLNTYSPKLCNDSAALRELEHQEFNGSSLSSPKKTGRNIEFQLKPVQLKSSSSVEDPLLVQNGANDNDLKELEDEIMALKTPAEIFFSQQLSEKEADPKSEVEQIDIGGRKNRNLLRVIVASSSSLFNTYSPKLCNDSAALRELEHQEFNGSSLSSPKKTGRNIEFQLKPVQFKNSSSVEDPLLVQNGANDNNLKKEEDLTISLLGQIRTELVQVREERDQANGRAASFQQQLVQQAHAEQETYLKKILAGNREELLRNRLPSLTLITYQVKDVSRSLTGQVAEIKKEGKEPFLQSGQRQSKLEILGRENSTETGSLQLGINQLQKKLREAEERIHNLERSEADIREKLYELIQIQDLYKRQSGEINKLKKKTAVFQASLEGERQESARLKEKLAKLKGEASLFLKIQQEVIEKEKEANFLQKYLNEKVSELFQTKEELDQILLRY